MLSYRCPHAWLGLPAPPVLLQVLSSKLLERSPQDEVKRAFTLFDLQQSGRITAKELALIARQLQVRMQLQQQQQQQHGHWGRPGNRQRGQKRNFGHTDRAQGLYIIARLAGICHHAAGAAMGFSLHTVLTPAGRLDGTDVRASVLCWCWLLCRLTLSRRSCRT